MTYLPSEIAAPLPSRQRRLSGLRLALLILLSLPVFRIGEAVGRLIFLPSFYDSFSHALTAEMWFSDLYFLYTRSRFGGWMFRFLILWLVAVPLALVLPAIRWRKTFCLVIGGICLILLELVTFRLEFHWEGRSESEWVWCLRSRDPELRRNAALGLKWHSLFKFGTPLGIFTMLRLALTDDIVEVRRFAAAFFVRFQNVDAIPELTQGLKDDDDEVRRSAAAALSMLGTRAHGSLPELEKSLQDGDPLVRIGAAEAYLRAGGDFRIGLPILEAAAGDKDQNVRSGAGHSLAKVGKIYPKDVAPLLRQLLRDKVRSVRFETTLACYDLGPGGSNVVPALLTNLKDEDVFVRGCSAGVLGRIRSADDNVVAALVDVLKNDPEGRVRENAAYALGYIGSPKARPALEAALRDPDNDVRKGAESALERIR